MANETRRGPGRPRREELSEQQRRVLDLLVDGKTNGEIGEALGISLDGAKYHMTAICDRIGVATREEAAEWWRQQRGFAARFAVSRGWSRLPAVVRLAIGGTAGVAVVAGVIAALVMLSDGEDGGIEERSGGLKPGLWEAVAAQDEPGEQGDLVEMKLAVHGPDGWQDLGATQNVAYIALSPGGEKLAMVEHGYETESGFFRWQIVLVDTQSGERKVVAQPASSSTAFGIIGWSPDSRILAAVDSREGDLQGTLLLLADGGILAQFPDVRSPIHNKGGPYPVLWSPDSRSLLLERDHSLVVLDIDGRVIATCGVDAVRGLLSASDFEQNWFVAYRWSTPATLVATVGVEGPANVPRMTVFDGRVSGGAITWERSDADGDAAEMGPLYSSGPGSPYPGSVAEIPGSHAWAATWHRPGMLAMLVTYNDAGTPAEDVNPGTKLALFVKYEGQYATIDLDLSQDYFGRPQGPDGPALWSPQVRWDAVVVE